MRSDAVWVGFLRMLWMFLFFLPAFCVIGMSQISQSYLLLDAGLILYLIAMMCYSIKSLAYTPALYLFADDPTIGVFGAVKKSVEITRGHLTEFFMFEFSFLLWRLFASLGLVGALFFQPYYQTTMAGFVDSLRVRNDPSLAPQTEEEAPQDE